MHNRPKISMESDSPYKITYGYICPMSIYLLYIKKNLKKNLKIDLDFGLGGAKNRFFGNSHSKSIIAIKSYL